MFNYEEKLNELFDSEEKNINYDTSYFKLPIEYNEPGTINDIVKSDLEMNGDNNIYKHLVSDSLLVHKWSSLYSSKKSFLKDTQQHIRDYPKTESFDSMLDEYKAFKGESNFMERYQYISLKCLKPLNNSSLFLQCLGLFNLASPVLSLLSPLVVLILPFMILKIRGIPITISLYISFLKQLLQKNGFYHMITNFNSIPAQQKMSSVMSLFFYMFQVYSNVLSCITFYRNTHRVSLFLNNYSIHLTNSIRLMEKIQASISKYKTYTGFYHDIEHHKSCMNRLLLRFNMILPYDNTLAKMSQIGHLMSLYYDIYYNDDLHNTFMFSIYLNQYDIDITSISLKCKEGLLRKCKYSKSTKITSMYYLPHIYDNPVKNNISLETNIIITGPNASGKTTLLKSALINVLMSQQFGYGCYKSAKIKIYDMFHSYLNIPDTSGRDSLFQAEARRCKDILECIYDNQDKQHLCIFDEIYSGTNPNDAVLCANLYLKGLNHYKKNVDYVLTTHYIQLCENFKKDTLVNNLKMDVRVSDDDIRYLYTIVPGISYIHGGKHILKNMNYPEYLFTL
jgi:hypothetical protein